MYTHRTNLSYYAYRIVGVAVEKRILVANLDLLIDSKLFYHQHMKVLSPKPTEI